MISDVKKWLYAEYNSNIPDELLNIFIGANIPNMVRTSICDNT